MLRRTFVAFVFAITAIWGTTAWSQVKEIPWGTSAVGSSGHRALVALADLLNKEMPEYRVTAQPTPGAIVSVKGYATGQFEGYYGSDIAFYELATGTNRFKGFKENMKRQPVQSMWVFTVEVGTAIHARAQDKMKSWGDLNGKRIFTGPRPWDVRAQLERAYRALGIEFEYVDVDLATAGSLLDSGRIDAFITYTNSQATTAPWIIETSLGTDWAALNPSAEEIAKLKKAGLAPVEVSADVFKHDIHADKILLVPFYYGFHVGLDIPADDVYKMLKVVEKNAQALAKTDSAYKQLAADMPALQRRGIEAAVEYVPIHPGLAKYMQEKGAWDKKWDSRVAKAK